MADLNRRTVLRGAAAAALVGGPFAGFVARSASAATTADAPARALRPVPDLRDGVVRLHLPEGFQYRSFHDNTAQAVVLDDGTVLPGRHDGMAAFPGPDDTVRLVRNHEVNGPGAAFGPGTPYDSMARGGTTTIEVTEYGEVRHAYTSLNGTQNNCNGGPMPWGSWISCEETVNGPDVGADFTGVPNVSLTQPHGFIFDVPADGQSDRQPVTAAGRFSHESVAFDPEEGVLYLTEDDFGFASGFYRYLPPEHPMKAGKLLDGGRLQMLAVQGTPNANLAAAQPERASYRVEWVDIDDPAPSFPYTPGEPAPTSNNDALSYVARQGWEQGAAYFSRLEGSAYDGGVVYFTATQGGGPAEVGTGPIADGYGNGSGQVWAYHIRGSLLQLVYESPGPDVLDLPDNVTTSARGTIVVCEDGTNDNYIRALSRGGDLSNIALNRLPGRFNEEFAGATFSPGGHTLFVNIQASTAMSFAIWGPWATIGV